MESKNKHFRQILTYFCKGKSAAQTRKKICAVYGDNAISDWTVYEWFRRFQRGDFKCTDLLRSGRPIKVDDEQLKSLIKHNPYFTTRKMAEILRISKSSVANHLHKLGYVNRCDIWMPHDAEEKLLVNPLYNNRMKSKFGLHTKNVLRVPRLRKNARIKSRWGARYHTAVHNAVIRKHPPYMPTEPPACLSEVIVESDPLYTCKHCKDCFRFQSSFEDHNKRRSWILGLWCHDCLVTVCTHATTGSSECLMCRKKDSDRRKYLRLKGLNKNQKLGATRIFYNQCQLFEHMKMHDITMVDMGSVMLMPIPAGLSNSDWTSELEIICEVLMEHAFVMRVHIMDWLKSHNLEDKWWKLIFDKNDDNVISKIFSVYRGGEIFKKLQNSTAYQVIDFDSPDTDVSKNSIDEFNTNCKNKNTNDNSVNIFDKNVTENEDNPCISSNITFVDCGVTMPHYFEPEESEPSMNLESSIEPGQLMEPELESQLSYVSKRYSTDVNKKSSQDITSRPANKDKINQRQIVLNNNINLLETNAVQEKTILVKDFNKNLGKQSSKNNMQQRRVQSLLKKSIENSVDGSAVEVSEILNSANNKIVEPLSSKHALFNLDGEQSLQSLITNNNPGKLKSAKIQSSNNANTASRSSNEIPSRFVSNKTVVHVGQDSRDTIIHGKNIEKQSKQLLDNSSTDNDTLSSVTCDAKKKQITDVLVVNTDKSYVIKSAKNVTENDDIKSVENITKQTASNLLILRKSKISTIPVESNKPEIEMPPLLFMNNAPYLSPSLSSSEPTFVNNNESFLKNLTVKVPSHMMSTTVSKNNLYEDILLIEQENGELYVKIKRVNHNIKGISRNICDTMFKLRHEMISEFQQLSSAELKKRITHLQQANEETKKVLDFLPMNILDEKLRAISTLLRILNENLQKCDQSAKDDNDIILNDDNDIILNEWESDLSKETSLKKCSTCDKLMKPQSYNVGFSKLSKNDDVYCTCYKYVCHECLSCQNNMAQFVAHQNFHKRKKPYVCPDCSIKFRCDKALEAHMWTVCFHTLKKRVFACKICEIDGFRDMESMIRHYVIMHCVSKVACEDCFKVFSSYGEYKNHRVQMHSFIPEQDSIIRLVICKLSGIVMRHRSYMSYLKEFQGIRKLIWFKCPFCPLITVENKHIISVLKTHLLNVHFRCLPMLISPEALALIFRIKYEDILVTINKALNMSDIVIPRIVNTETITSETFERVSQDSYDESLKSNEIVDVNPQSAEEKKNKEKVESFPKILNVRSIADLKRPEPKSSAIVETATKKDFNVQLEVKTENVNLLNQNKESDIESIETTESDMKSVIKKETVDDRSNDSSIALCAPKSEKSPKTKPNDIHINSSESSKSGSNSDSVPKTNTDGRIKVIDIRKICKPDIVPLVTAELCDSQMKDEDESLVISMSKPPPLARIPQYMFQLTEPTESESRNVRRSSTRRNDKAKGHIAIYGPTDRQQGVINYLCPLCDEQINTSCSVMHFSEKHSDECELAVITLQLQRLSPDFINDGYKQHLASSKKRKSDALFVSKKKRRWTPKRYVDLSAPAGLCVEQETAEDGEGNFKCKRCGQRCTDMSDLREHIAANHRLKGRYLICLECGENFVVAPSLQMHLKAFHGIEDPIVYMSQNPLYAPDIDGDWEAEGKTTVANQCHVCMAVFEDKAAVDKHLRVHGMAFLNRKRIEAARNAQKSSAKNTNTEEDKRSIVKDNPTETVKREKPAETILEKLNAVM